MGVRNKEGGPRSVLSHLCVRADLPLSEGLTMAQWDPKVGLPGSRVREAVCQQMASQGHTGAGGPATVERVKQVHYLPTQGGVPGEVLRSQDVSVDHVLHKGEVYQVLPVPAGAQGMSILRLEHSAAHLAEPHDPPWQCQPRDTWASVKMCWRPGLLGLQGQRGI